MTKTGPFLFVKPANPKKGLGTAYSGDSPRYAYDHASWEWLLERVLRRTLIPWALEIPHSREILAGHEDQYSMHRWGSYGWEYGADVLPGEYNGISPGAVGHLTDANLSEEDRTKLLPWSWDATNGVPSYTARLVVYGITATETEVARLPFSIEWLHPDWESSDLDAWDLTAYTTETTQGSLGSSRWSWTTNVKNVPYEIPTDLPFKCLSHMRTDDDTVMVSITNDDSETIRVETAPTPISAPRTTDGSIIETETGKQVRSAEYGAAYGAGWALNEFSILINPTLDYGDSTASVAYGRGGKSGVSINTIGRLVDYPGKNSGSIVVRTVSGIGSIHEVDWDGKPTWWHANDFPKGLNSVLSSKMKSQMEALCPVCQPAIPPAIPALPEKLPDAGLVPWKHTNSGGIMCAPLWMKHLALACTPFDMSKRLDAMTTTVHRVSTVFAKIKTVTTKHLVTTHAYLLEGSHDYKEELKYEESSLEKVTVEGTSSNPIQSGNLTIHTSVSGRIESDYNSTGYINPGEDGYDKSTKEQRTWEEKFESNSDFLVCLRSTENTTMSTKTTTETSRTVKYLTSGSQDISESNTYSDGELPDSYNPDPDDLLFPDWVLPWIKTAELFASIESKLIRRSTYGTSYHESYHIRETYDADTGEPIINTISKTGSGSGTRIHKARRKIISLGKMDLTTGRFPAIDAASILFEVDPDPTDPVGPISIDDFPKSFTENYKNVTDLDKERRDLTSDCYVEDNLSNERSRTISYYVVVKWKFDRTNPETLETDSSLAGRYRNLSDARNALSNKERELSNAGSALESAKASLESAKASLESSQSALALAKKLRADPAGAEAELRKEAEADLDRADEELSDAQNGTSNARSDKSNADRDMQSAESSLQSAQAAYDAAVADGTGVEEAKAELETAYTAYYKAINAYGEAFSKLAGAISNETAAQEAYDASKGYYDTLSDNIEEILQKAVDDAEAAVDKATSMVNELENKVLKTEDELLSIEAKVDEAEQEILDAGGPLPSS